MEFAGLAVTQSSILRSLHIEWSYSSAEVGSRFLQVLADHHIHWLENLTIANEKAWFKDGQDGCMESLIKLVSRQAKLKLLNMNHGYENYLSEEHM